jgi:hypothetical protein
VSAAARSAPALGGSAGGPGAGRAGGGARDGDAPGRPTGAAVAGHGRRATVALLLGVWTVFGVLWLSPRLLNHLVADYPLRWLNVAVGFSYAYFWAALTPLVFLVVRRWPLGRRDLRQNVPVHLAALVAFLVLDRGFMLASDLLLGWIQWQPPVPDSAIDRFLRLVVAGTPLFLLTYAVVAGVAHAVAYRRLARERELRAARLEERLARTDVQRLAMQLQPPFLFDTLGAVSRLVREDPRRADRLLTRLSDLLRLTLDHAGRTEVSLGEEIQFLEAYLEIERARFGNRVRVDLDVAADALDARVPNLLLQPLVEGAVRRGVEAGGEPGRIEVHAGRRNGTIQLRVREDGAGLAPDAPDERIAAMRDRLRQLYGPDGFELADGDGGRQITLTIPWAGAGGDAAARGNGESHP